MNNAELIEELETIRDTLVNSVNATLDRLLQVLDGEGAAAGSPAELVFPFTADTNIFIGKKPAAVLFGEERVEAKTWREVYTAIIGRCNADPECRERLMYLRGKIAGRDRLLLSHSPDTLRRPLKVGEDMYAEACYGTATLLYILRDRILAPARFDYSNISIAIKWKAGAAV